MSAQEMVAEFHEAYGVVNRLADGTIEGVPTVKVPEVQLRYELIREEFHEFIAGLSTEDVVEVADALADMVYVIYGTALTFGIDLDAVIEEVHRSNMSKLGEDGKPIMRMDGKILKGPNYSPPDIRGVLGL